MEIIHFSRLFVIFFIGYSDLAKINDYMVNIRHAKKKDLDSRDDPQQFKTTSSYGEYDDYQWTSSSEDPTSSGSTADFLWLPEATTEDESYVYFERTVDESFTNDFKEDVVTKFLRIVESQHELGANCTAGTDLNLGEGIVDRYAQVR